LTNKCFIYEKAADEIEAGLTK